MKKFGFGMMRLPQIDENPEHIDQEQLNKIIDTYRKMDTTTSTQHTLTIMEKVK